MKFVQIGFIKKTHGLSGELKAAIEEPYEELFFEAERVYLELKGKKVPYFIERVRGGGDPIVLFEDIKDRESAFELQSTPIFMPATEIEMVAPLEDKPREYEHLAGYFLKDAQAGDVGRIEEVLEMPQQEMAFLRYNEREILVPLNKTFIQSIDKKSKVVLVDLPYGLLDM